VSSSCGPSWISVYSSVMRTALWPAIFEASMLDAPSSCRHVILARRKEWGPRPGSCSPRQPPPASGLPDAGFPQRQAAAVRPGEHPRLRLRVFRRGLGAVPVNQIAQRERALAGLRFRTVDVAEPVALHRYGICRSADRRGATSVRVFRMSWRPCRLRFPARGGWDRSVAPAP